MGSLTVNFTIAGSAVFGVDYEAIAASVVIPPGATYQDVVITPIQGSALRGKRKVVLTLSPVAGFAIGSSRAMVTIRDTPAPDRLTVREGTRYMVDVNGNGGPSLRTFNIGSGAEEVLVGDFNQDGRDDIILRSGNIYRVYTSGSGGAPTQTLQFAGSSDKAFIGDFDGDGRDDLITRRGNLFYVDTLHTGGAPGAVFRFGRATDELVLGSDGIHTGDWDGDGRDDIVLRRGNQFLVRLSSNGRTVSFHFGSASDSVYLADMNGDGRIEPVCWNGANTYKADIHHDERTPRVLRFGRATDYAFASDVDGTGIDCLIIKRGSEFLIDLDRSGGPAEKVISFGGASDAFFLLKGW